jgi:hypothetical protein
MKMRCHEHDAEYEEVETTLRVRGATLNGVKALRCPVGGEEVFTAEQMREIERRLSEVTPLKLRRKITSSGRRPALILPEDILQTVNAKTGDRVDIYTDGRRIIIEPVEQPEA